MQHTIVELVKQSTLRSVQRSEAKHTSTEYYRNYPFFVVEIFLDGTCCLKICCLNIIQV